MSNIKKINQDKDILETKEWLESIKSVIDNSGINRAHFILNQLISYSRINGVKMPFKAYTDYVNTIPLKQQKPYKGDRAIER